nr:accessory Sec system translocase SecA2 [Leuconostoc sp. LN180020]
MLRGDSVSNLNKQRLRQLNKILKQVNKWQSKIAEMSDTKLQNQTQLFRQRLKNGETLDKLLPEAFATIREADKRILGKFPYDVQVIGGIVLHQGNIAEMKTGEGKTLTATLPVYLNALTGQGTMVITTNSYLAIRDYSELRSVYEWLGLSVAVGVNEDPDYEFSVYEKSQMYHADVLYTTNDAVGFDYLQENLASNKEDQFLRQYNYAILDEVDAILLDSAQMPLIISGAPRVQSNLFEIANKFVMTLDADVDFEMDDEKKHVWLTSNGIEAAQRFFEQKFLFSAENYLVIRHIQLALHAKMLFEKNEDYVIDDDQVKLLDDKNGRIMSGTKLQSGLHQAIEAKEHVPITPQMRAMASITYQNLFRMFKKLAGMTGTGRHDEEEFIETYNMSVTVVPTHKPVIRKDYPDKIYTTLPEKLYASIALVKHCYNRQQPVLLTTGSVELSEIYSQMLLKEGIAHSVLNARNVAKESAIISEAGQLGSVTVATVMAGRGTDIKLGPGVAELGGLAVIGTERMTSKRIDQQLRGRSGRQGDPGFSQFFVSLEDDIVIQRGSEKSHRYLRKHSSDVNISQPKELKHMWFRKIIDRAQFSEESQARLSRLNTLQFDESVRIQRNIVYQERARLINNHELLDDTIMGMTNRVITDFLNVTPNLTEQALSRFILDNINYNLKNTDNILSLKQKEDVRHELLLLVQSILREKAKLLPETSQVVEYQRLTMLKALDVCWIEQVDHLQQLRTIVVNRRFSQHNPIFEYQKEAKLSYNEMKKHLDQTILRNVMLTEITHGKNGEILLSFP